MYVKKNIWQQYHVAKRILFYFIGVILVFFIWISWNRWCERVMIHSLRLLAPHLACISSCVWAPLGISLMIWMCAIPSIRTLENNILIVILPLFQPSLLRFHFISHNFLLICITPYAWWFLSCGQQSCTTHQFSPYPIRLKKRHMKRCKRCNCCRV